MRPILLPLQSALRQKTAYRWIFSRRRALADPHQELAPFARMVLLLVILWLVFNAAMYAAEPGQVGSSIDSYGAALYWGIAAFSTSGIAQAPLSGLSQLPGSLWLVIGSILYFGAIVATVTPYFMRPLQRPHRQIIGTIKYILEQLHEFDLDELDLLKDTVDTLIVHVGSPKQKQSWPASRRKRPGLETRRQAGHAVIQFGAFAVVDFAHRVAASSKHSRAHKSGRHRQQVILRGPFLLAIPKKGKFAPILDKRVYNTKGSGDKNEIHAIRFHIDRTDDRGRHYRPACRHRDPAV